MALCHIFGLAPARPPSTITYRGRCTMERLAEALPAERARVAEWKLQKRVVAQQEKVAAQKEQWRKLIDDSDSANKVF